jgi:hypothetical protein
MKEHHAREMALKQLTGHCKQSQHMRVTRHKSHLLPRLNEQDFSSIFLIIKIIRNPHFRIATSLERIVNRKLGTLVSNWDTRIAAFTPYLRIHALGSRLGLVGRIIDVWRKNRPAKCPGWVAGDLMQCLAKEEDSRSL